MATKQSSAAASKNANSNQTSIHNQANRGVTELRGASSEQLASHERINLKNQEQRSQGSSTVRQCESHDNRSLLGERPAGQTKYIPYPKAMKSLASRLKATPEELAAWVACGPEDGGLRAYLNANELVDPPLFSYGYYTGTDNTDYLSPLTGCWFIKDEIASFAPNERYITGKSLIERWSELLGELVEPFVLAKIRESRLFNLRPIFQIAEVNFSCSRPFPAVETGLFSLLEIEAIEATDFDETESTIGKMPIGHLNHDQELQERANQIAAGLTTRWRNPAKHKVAKALAAERGMGIDTVLRRIRKQWK